MRRVSVFVSVDLCCLAESPCCLLMLTMCVVGLDLLSDRSIGLRRKPPVG